MLQDMDIANAFIEALAALMVNTSAGVVGDAYALLKQKFRQVMGAWHPAVKALETLEADPGSHELQEALIEKVKSSEVDKSELTDAVDRLRGALNEPGLKASCTTINQKATGRAIAQASHGSVAAVSVSSPGGPRHE